MKYFLFPVLFVLSLAYNAQADCPVQAERSKSGKELYRLPGVSVYRSGNELGLQQKGSLGHTDTLRLKTDNSQTVRIDAVIKRAAGNNDTVAKAYLTPEGELTVIYTPQDSEEGFQLTVAKNKRTQCRPLYRDADLRLEAKLQHRGLKVAKRRSLLSSSNLVLAKLFGI